MGDNEANKEVVENGDGPSHQVEECQPKQSQPNRKSGRGQKRRQRANVNRLPGVPLHSLFPGHQDAFDLRDVLGRPMVPPLGDATPWWHQRPQNSFHQIPAKKPRINDNKYKKSQNADKDKFDEPFDDIDNPLKYVIVPTDYPDSIISDEQSSEIQRLLMDDLLKLGEREDFPRFWGCYLRYGSLILFCYNEKTREWLEGLVPTLCLENGFKVKTGAAKDILQTTKISFTLPKLLCKTEDDIILKLMNTQNKGLRTNFWKLLESKEDDKGKTLTVAIDEESFKNIKSANYKAHLGLSLVKFQNSAHFNITQYKPN